MAKKKQARKAKRAAGKAPEWSAEQFIRSLKIKQVRLLQSAANLTIKGKTRPEKFGLKVHVSVGSSEEEGLVKGDLECLVDWFYEGEKEPSVFVHCKFQILYIVPDGKMPTENEISQLQQSMSAMVCFQAWPYAREHIHSLCVKMGMPVMYLPALVAVSEEGTLKFEPAPPPADKSPKPQ